MSILPRKVCVKAKNKRVEMNFTNYQLSFNTQVLEEQIQIHKTLFKRYDMYKNLCKINLSM